MSWTHFFQQNLFIRPEAVYSTALDNPALQQGTKYTQAVFAVDLVVRFQAEFPTPFLCAAADCLLDFLRSQSLY